MTMAEASTSAMAGANEGQATIAAAAAASKTTTTATNPVPPQAIIDHDELTDLRAYQRTFDGAYTRTALGQLGYAIVILRLFQRDFYWCGLVYTVLAAQLILVAIYRYNLALSNESRSKLISLTPMSRESGQDDNGAAPNSHVAAASHTEHAPLFRGTFITAGTMVACTTLCTLLLEIALVVLVIRM